MQMSKLLAVVTTALLLGVLIKSGAETGFNSAQAQALENPLTTVKPGHCEADDTFAIAIHGGAVLERSNQDRKVSFVESVLAEAQKLLASGARGIDVVEAVIASMENSGVFNAGKGSIANEEGTVELDAAIMDGRQSDAGAVASVETVRNPISAARLVLDKSRHVMLVGPDAENFVRQNGGIMVGSDYFLDSGKDFSNVPLPDDIVITPPNEAVSPDRAKFSGAWGGLAFETLHFILIVEEITEVSAKVIWALGPHPYTGNGQYRRLVATYVDEGIQVTEPAEMGGFTLTYQLNQDGFIDLTAQKAGEPTELHEMHRISLPQVNHDSGTVGAVVRDRCGDLAAGTSTGGFDAKTPGRVGDVPIIGAGTYAENETAAISATGEGEFFMRYVVAHDITAAMKYTGISLDQAATNVINVKLANKTGRGGVIAVDREGNVAMPFNTVGMVRGTATNTQPPSVSVY